MIRILCLLLTIGLLTAPTAFAADKKGAPAPHTKPSPAAKAEEFPPLPDSIATTLEGDLPDGPAQLLRLTPDKIELVTLDRDAAHVMVGNPKHVLGIIETPRSLVLVPRAPGASHLKVTDAAGHVIYERSVIVAAPSQDYVRIRKTCAEGQSGCKEYNVYYCPDMCHQVVLSTDANSTSSAATPANPAAAGNGGATPPETVNDGAMQTDPNLGNNLGGAAMMP